jgi:hypothetical protein
MSNTTKFVIEPASIQSFVWEELEIEKGIPGRHHTAAMQQQMRGRGAVCARRGLRLLVCWLTCLPDGSRETADLLEVEHLFEQTFCEKSESLWDDEFIASDEARLRWCRVGNTKALLLKIELQTLFWNKETKIQVAKTTCRTWADKDFGPWIFEDQLPSDLLTEVPEGELLFTSGPQLSDFTGSLVSSDNGIMMQERTVEEAIIDLSTSFGLSLEKMSEAITELLRQRSQTMGALSTRQ